MLEIETTNTCNASCPQCLRTNEDTLAPTLFDDDLDWELALSNIPTNFWRQLERINFNGSTGDNISHRDIQSIVAKVIELAPQAHIRVCTNGSLRTTKWWKILGSITKDSNVEVIFGIDGLEDTHKLYRVGTNWGKIIENARAFVSAGGRATWQMILFEHNLHQVDACRQLAKDYGFSEFYLRSENRFFGGKTEQAVFWKGQQTHTIQYPDQSKLPNILKEEEVVNTWSQALQPLGNTKSISCRSIETKWLAIYADGTVWPCCWLMGWHRASHLTQFNLINYHFKKILNIDFNQISLYHNNLKDIVNSDLWQQRYPESFSRAPNPVCIQQCSNCSN